MLLVHFVHADLALTATTVHHLIGHIPISFIQIYSHVLFDTAMVAHNLSRKLAIFLTVKVDVKDVGNTLISFMKGHTER